MPSTKYTRIEITPEAYRALEAEAILQEKTLKKLASELILRGISKEALDFIKKAGEAKKSRRALDSSAMERAIEEIGATGMSFDQSILENMHDIIQDEGYSEGMLYAVQNTASMQRDELHRVLNICERHGLTNILAADIILNLNKIESGTR
jgi:sugar-specific transcriptional regulator TrmB